MEAPWSWGKRGPKFAWERLGSSPREAPSAPASPLTYQEPVRVEAGLGRGGPWMGGATAPLRLCLPASHTAPRQEGGRCDFRTFPVSPILAVWGCRNFSVCWWWPRPSLWRQVSSALSLAFCQIETVPGPDTCFPGFFENQAQLPAEWVIGAGGTRVLATGRAEGNLAFSEFVLWPILSPR